MSGTSGTKEFRTAFARLGGLARAKKLSKKRRREIGMLGAHVRWSKQKLAVKHKDNGM